MTSPDYSREFVPKLPRHHARRARGGAKEGSILEQYVDRLSGEPTRRQARRHRACEVERHCDDLGAKKISIVDVAFFLSGCSRSLRE
jgi:hypothetical protein